MSQSLFISDLHLCADNPRSMQLFERFIAGPAAQAEALYILGDLFEYWAGDDDLASPFNQHACDLLRSLDAQGTRLFIMHGNRDFLMDEELGSACNATLLDDPAQIDLYGTPTLLMHGDTLCTDDTEYQQFRKMVRDERWQAQFLAQPLAARKALIEQVRTQSKDGKQAKAMEIMDVNAGAVDEVLRQHGYPRLIHGHTHRPARHLHHPDGRTCERWVLGDWDAGQASILKVDASGVTAQLFS